MTSLASLPIGSYMLDMPMKGSYRYFHISFHFRFPPGDAGSDHWWHGLLAIAIRGPTQLPPKARAIFVLSHTHRRRIAYSTQTVWAFRPGTRGACKRFATMGDRSSGYQRGIPRDRSSSPTIYYTGLYGQGTYPRRGIARQRVGSVDSAGVGLLNPSTLFHARPCRQSKL